MIYVVAGESPITSGFNRPGTRRAAITLLDANPDAARAATRRANWAATRAYGTTSFTSIAGFLAKREVVVMACDESVA